MDRIVSNHSAQRTCRQVRGNRGAADPGFHDSVHPAIVFSDLPASVGHAPTCRSRAPLRAVQILEELLGPISGDRATSVAGALIKRFGSLGRVVSAPLEQLNEVCGEERTGPIIHAARAIVEAALREEVVGSPVDSMDPALGRYLRSRFGDFRNERMHAIFLDGQQLYIADENVSEGTHGDVVLHSRQLLARAFNLNAVRLIIAHNHPSDACSPSPADVEATRRLKELCSAVDLVLQDHLIITRSRCFSMKKGGYLSPGALINGL